MTSISLTSHDLDEIDKLVEATKGMDAQVKKYGYTAILNDVLQRTDTTIELQKEGQARMLSAAKYLGFFFLALGIVSLVDFALTLNAIAMKKESHVKRGTLTDTGGQVIQVRSTDFALGSNGEMVVSVSSGQRRLAELDSKPVGTAPILSKYKLSSRIPNKYLQELEQFSVAAGGEAMEQVKVTSFKRLPKEGSHCGSVVVLQTTQGEFTLDDDTLFHNGENMAATGFFDMLSDRRLAKMNISAHGRRLIEQGAVPTSVDAQLYGNFRFLANINADEFVCEMGGIIGETFAVDAPNSPTIPYSYVVSLQGKCDFDGSDECDSLLTTGKKPGVTQYSNFSTMTHYEQVLLTNTHRVVVSFFASQPLSRLIKIHQFESQVITQYVYYRTESTKLSCIAKPIQGASKEGAAPDMFLAYLGTRSDEGEDSMRWSLSPSHTKDDQGKNVRDSPLATEYWERVGTRLPRRMFLSGPNNIAPGVTVDFLVTPQKFQEFKEGMSADEVDEWFDETVFGKLAEAMTCPSNDFYVDHPQPFHRLPAAFGPYSEAGARWIATELLVGDLDIFPFTWPNSYTKYWNAVVGSLGTPSYAGSTYPADQLLEADPGPPGAFDDDIEAGASGRRLSEAMTRGPLTCMTNEALNTYYCEICKGLPDGLAVVLGMKIDMCAGTAGGIDEEGEFTACFFYFQIKGARMHTPKWASYLGVEVSVTGNVKMCLIPFSVRGVLELKITNGYCFDFSWWVGDCALAWGIYGGLRITAFAGAGADSYLQGDAFIGLYGGFYVSSFVGGRRRDSCYCWKMALDGTLNCPRWAGISGQVTFTVKLLPLKHGVDADLTGSVSFKFAVNLFGYHVTLPKVPDITLFNVDLDQPMGPPSDIQVDEDGQKLDSRLWKENAVCSRGSRKWLGGGSTPISALSLQECIALVKETGGWRFFTWGNNTNNYGNCHVYREVKAPGNCKPKYSRWFNIFQLERPCKIMGGGRDQRFTYPAKTNHMSMCAHGQGSHVEYTGTHCDSGHRIQWKAWRIMNPAVKVKYTKDADDDEYNSDLCTKCVEKGGNKCYWEYKKAQYSRDTSGATGRPIAGTYSQTWKNYYIGECGMPPDRMLMLPTNCATCPAMIEYVVPQKKAQAGINGWANRQYKALRNTNKKMSKWDLKQEGAAYLCLNAQKQGGSPLFYEGRQCEDGTKIEWYAMANLEPRNFSGTVGSQQYAHKCWGNLATYATPSHRHPYAPEIFGECGQAPGLFPWMPARCDELIYLNVPTPRPTPKRDTSSFASGGGRR